MPISSGSAYNQESFGPFSTADGDLIAPLGLENTFEAYASDRITLDSDGKSDAIFLYTTSGYDDYQWSVLDGSSPDFYLEVFNFQPGVDFVYDPYYYHSTYTAAFNTDLNGDGITDTIIGGRWTDYSGGFSNRREVLADKQIVFYGVTAAELGFTWNDPSWNNGNLYKITSDRPSFVKTYRDIGKDDLLKTYRESWVESSSPSSKSPDSLKQLDGIDYENLKRTIYRRPEGQTLRWYVHDGPSITRSLATTGDTFTVLDPKPEAISFIEETFEFLDTKLELDFERTYSIESSQINILGVSAGSLAANAGADVMGYATPQLALDFGYVDVVVGLEENIEALKYVLIHEIGHALGLSHPENEGAAAGFSSSDTVMSYNAPPYFSSYRDLDIAALQSIWGEEGSYTDDPIISGGSSLISLSRDETRRSKFTNGSSSLMVDTNIFDVDQVKLVGTARTSRQYRKLVKKNKSHFIYSSYSGVLSYDSNLDSRGFGSIDQVAVLTNKPRSLSTSDFTLL